MATITRIDGINEVRTFIAGISNLPPKVLDDMADVAYGTMRAGAGRHSPRINGTGRLFNSLFREGQGTLTQTVGHDADVAPHAAFVVFGTPAHEITPRNARFLSWLNINGNRVFAKSVWHRGYIGDNYRDVALSDAFRRFPDFVDTALKEI